MRAIERRWEVVWVIGEGKWLRERREIE